VYYRTASNVIQKRVDTVGTWQDLMGGTPVPPTSPAFNAPAFLRMYNFSEWWSYNPGGVEYTRRNNSDGTCASYFVRSGLGGPNVRWEAYSRVDGATTSVEMDGADAYADWGPAADGVTRINASLYKFNETCGPCKGMRSHPPTHTHVTIPPARLPSAGHPHSDHHPFVLLTMIRRRWQRRERHGRRPADERSPPAHNTPPTDGPRAMDRSRDLSTVPALLLC
jgi:hypothetical protein